MHLETSQTPTSAVSPDVDSRPWWKELTGYQWFVFVVAALGWLFDTMDQQFFNLARKPAIMHLIKAPEPERSPGRQVRRAMPP